MLSKIRAHMNNEIDKLLPELRKSLFNDSRLKHLESDVWARIIARKQDNNPIGVLERFLAFLFPAQYRIAPFICAALIGAVVGFGTLQPNSTLPDAAETLNLKVFKPQIISLALLTPIDGRL
jgi:hypothetical protein